MTTGQVTVNMTTGTSAMLCAQCGAYTNPCYYVDGRLLCRQCAHVPQPNPTFECPFCKGTGRMS